MTEMQHYIYAHEDYQSYVGFYSRLDTVLRRLNVMMVGYPRAGKTCLVDTLLGKPFRETQCTNGIDLSTCSVTANPVEADELNWSSPEQPFSTKESTLNYGPNFVTNQQYRNTYAPLVTQVIQLERIVAVA